MAKDVSGFRQNPTFEPADHAARMKRLEGEADF